MRGSYLVTPHPKRLWPHGASMGGCVPPGGRRPRRIVHGPHPRSGGSSSSSTCRRLPSQWGRDGGSGCASAQPSRGFRSSWWSSGRHGARWGMRPSAPCRRGRRASGGPRGTQRRSSCPPGALVRSAHGGTRLRADSPPVGQEGTERRRERPQEPPEPTRGARGKNTCPTVKHGRLINAALVLLFWSATDAGRTHDQRIAEAPPSPVPAGSRWLQDLGVPALTRSQVEGIMPTKQPRGRALTRAPKAANQRIARRRGRLAPVTSRVTHGRMGHETNRRRKVGVRAVVRAVCGALPHFRVRLTPWQPMVESG